MNKKNLNQKFYRWLILGTVPGLVILAAMLITAIGHAQDNEIEIINRDGERVTGRVILQEKEEGKATVRAGGGAGGSVDGGVTVTNDNGKITIVDADGNKREIDVSGAQSVIVNQAVKSIMKDGEEQTQRFGKAIIIGPDGKRQEIELGGPIDGDIAVELPGVGGGLMSVPGLQGMLKLDRNSTGGKYYIGVHCSAVPASLSAQLNLEEGSGLLVDDVSPDSPAEAAGIKKFDILMFADDSRLAETQDLIDVVQQAGEDESKLSLTILRRGKEIGVDVAPAERPANQRVRVLGPLGDLNLNEDFDLKMEQLGPGMIVGPDQQWQQDFQLKMQEDARRFQDEMKKMQEEMRKMQEMMQKQLEQNKDQ